ncbi:hypothetical protein ACQ4M3_32815 [Leptolyngbya sp. AN03gr2]|uniref:hypothetical protein n=1 Tax=unclassified Leptolyngbya TaxID=2650499 RepID=UPI003D313D9A
MAFPVQPHSAEKVQHDINTILEAIIRFLSKISSSEPSKKLQEPIQITAELEPEEQLVIDAEIIPEVEALPYRNPELLEGGRAYPQLTPEVRLQLNSLYMAVPLPELQQSLEQLSPQRLATLAGAISSPALPPATENQDVIDIEVDGVQCFRQEKGQVIVNDLLPSNSLEAVQSASEIQQNRDTEMTTEIGELEPSQPTTELRPVGEAESLIGQQLGDLSTVHNEVLHQAPSIRVERDQYGAIKGGAAIRAVVEPTEVEADAEYRSEHPLTPEAKAIVTQLHDYFDQSGEQELTGKRDYNIQADGDRILFIPRDNSAEVITVQGDQAVSISSERIEHLMVRFAAAYESIRTTEQVSDRNTELTR